MYKQKLSDCELDVMQILWDLGPEMNQPEIKEELERRKSRVYGRTTDCYLDDPTEECRFRELGCAWQGDLLLSAGEPGGLQAPGAGSFLSPSVRRII